MNSNEQEEERKRQLQKLIREYESNSGMAGFVCGKPVELMPASEQDRIFNGFVTNENIKIFEVAEQKLLLAKGMDLTDSEEKKIEKAIPTSRQLICAFKAYQSNSFNRDKLREEVRKILFKPIPETIDGLNSSISHLVDALNFLTEQFSEKKDSWDLMVDCSQMYDVLSRTKLVCESLLSFEEKDLKYEIKTLNSTLNLAKDNLEVLEVFFKEGKAEDILKKQFKNLANELTVLWGITS